MPKNAKRLYCEHIINIQVTKMTGLLKIILMLGLIAVLAGCGQKGDLYLPSQLATEVMSV